MIPTLPNVDVEDEEYKVESAALLEDIKGEKDET